MNYWLMKTEPDEFSIDDLKRKKSEPWSGVRNYQARNYMRDGMRKGDGVLFYHSSCAVPGVAGVARVASGPYPDATQFDPQSHYYDPKATPEQPRWISVDVQAVAAGRYLALTEMKMLLNTKPATTAAMDRPALIRRSFCANKAIRTVASNGSRRTIQGNASSCIRVSSS